MLDPAVSAHRFAVDTGVGVLLVHRLAWWCLKRCNRGR